MTFEEEIRIRAKEIEYRAIEYRLEAAKFDIKYCKILIVLNLVLWLVTAITLIAQS